MAKKRKETPPSTTLHDFFGKSGSTSVKKAKLDSSTRRPLKTKQNTSFAVAPEDIIVIESDDDEPVASRMVISKPDSDIKFVDEPPPKNSITGEARPSAAQKKNSRKIAKYENYAELKVENNSAEISKTSVAPVLLGVDDLELVQFGQPSALLLRSGTPQLRPSAEEFSFGSPVLLQPHTQLRPTSETSDFQVVQGDSDEDPNDLKPIPSEEQIPCSTPPIVVDKPRLDAAKPLVPPEEEWGTGDDELEFQDVIMEADDKMTIDVDVDLTVDTDDESSEERNTETCPICNMLLEGMEKLVRTEISSYQLLFYIYVYIAGYSRTRQQLYRLYCPTVLAQPLYQSIRRIMLRWAISQGTPSSIVLSATPCSSGAPASTQPCVREGEI